MSNVRILRVLGQFRLARVFFTLILSPLTLSAASEPTDNQVFGLLILFLLFGAANVMTRAINNSHYEYMEEKEKGGPENV